MKQFNQDEFSSREIYTLYLSFKYFKGDEKKDIKDFGIKLNKEFDRLTSESITFNEKRKRLLSNNNNNSIFYLGIEPKIENKLEDKFKKVGQIYLKDRQKFEVKKCKTYIEKGKKAKVLISILLIDKSFKINNTTHYKFILYPIEFISHIK